MILVLGFFVGDTPMVDLRDLALGHIRLSPRVQIRLWV